MVSSNVVGTMFVGGSGQCPVVSLRFTDLPMFGGSGFYVNVNDSGTGGINAGPVTLQDCDVVGGEIQVEFAFASGNGDMLMNFNNNLFDRCTFNFTRADQAGSGGPFDDPINCYNNLFHGGSLNIDYNLISGGESSPPDWSFYDNLMEGLNFTYRSFLSNEVPNGYNGYVNWNAKLLFSRGGDQTLSNADYQTGALGLYYYPAIGTNLAELIHQGSRPASTAGLYYYTVTTNNVIDGTNTVSIGYHSVGLDASGLPQGRPMLTISPPGRTANLGDHVVFTATAAGLTPMTFQWQFNGTNLNSGTNLINGTNISGVATATLTVNSVQSTNYGLYTVLATNALGWGSASAWLRPPSTNSLDGLGFGIDASPAIGPDGVIYIANLGSKIFALDPISGAIKWSNSIVTDNDGDITSSAAMAADNSAVYIGSQDSSGGFLLAMSPTNGRVLWSNFLGGQISSSPAINSACGAIYVGVEGTSNGLFSLSTNGTTTNWVFQTADPVSGGNMGIDSSPCVGPDGMVYFLAQNDLYAVASDGILKWFFPAPVPAIGFSGTPAGPAGSPALDANNNILFGSGDGYVYCVNPNGGLQWFYDTGTASPINSSVAVGSNFVVVAASTNLYAITNGGLYWQFSDPTNKLFVSSPAIAAGNVAVIGSEDNYVYGITNGSIAWSNQTGGQVLSSPAISPLTGAIVIASEDGKVYSLPGTGAATGAPWPMFHAIASHSGAAPNITCPGGSVSAFPNNPTNSGGRFAFSLTGSPGSAWTVYASTNLTNWAQVGSASLDPVSGNAQITDVTSFNFTNRYYEAVSSGVCSPIIGFANLALPAVMRTSGWKSILWG